MTEAGPALLDAVADESADSLFRVIGSDVRFRGRVWDVCTDEVELSADERVIRDVVRHPSAVAVLALDADDRVLIVRQYRHPVRSVLWELPAGLLDIAAEPPLEAARRELWEETHHEADTWSVLVDFFASPGMCNEAVRIYLATDVRPASGDRFARHGEERDMQVAWVPLESLRDAVLAGHLHNPTLVTGTLATVATRAAPPSASGRVWGSAPGESLRPADAPWPFGPRGRLERS
jgi:8-oxo-dGDP phosphatase